MYRYLIILYIYCLSLPLSITANGYEAVQLKSDSTGAADSLTAALHYRTGKIELACGAALQTPDGFRYLDGAQSRQVLENLWGNAPHPNTLGMLLPEHINPDEENVWAVEISFEPLGYVDDSDADEIDYALILQEMKKGMEEEGLHTASLTSWASPPFYDTALKALHWPMAFRFGESEQHVLNYEVRLLGRKGVLCINAVGNISRLAEVRRQMPVLLQHITFTKGNRYIDYNPLTDRAGEWGIYNLATGKAWTAADLRHQLAIMVEFLLICCVIGGGCYLVHYYFNYRQLHLKRRYRPMIDESLN